MGRAGMMRAYELGEIVGKGERWIGGRRCGSGGRRYLSKRSAGGVVLIWAYKPV